MENIENARLFGYVQCDVGLLENCREKLAIFPAVFKVISVSREKRTYDSFKRMLISSYFLEN